MRVVLRAEQLSKDFEAGAGEIVSALRNLDLVVESGTSTAIVGRNGAGKSTLLRLLAGVSAPGSGRVERSSNTVSVIELGAGFEPDLTGRENLDLTLGLLGIKGALRPSVASAALAFADIGEAVDRPVRWYSTGMIARLSLGAALSVKPDLIVVDEVLGVGDAAFQRRVVGEVRRQVSAGAALILVTHNLVLAEALCDRAVWLENGSVEADGPATSVLGQYLRAISPLPTRAEQEHTRLKWVRVEPVIVDPGEPITVQAALARSAKAPPIHLRVDVRPPAGLDGTWMRGGDETDVDRELNVVAKSAPFLIAETGEDLVVTASVDSLGITPSVLEVAVVATTPDENEILDEAGTLIQVSGDQEVPRFHMQVSAERMG